MNSARKVFFTFMNTFPSFFPNILFLIFYNFIQRKCKVFVPFENRIYFSFHNDSFVVLFGKENLTFLNSKECVRLCVQHTHNLELIKELLGFFLVANDETRKNVTCLIKEAITSTIKNMDEAMVIGLLEFLQTDKKIKTLTDTSELTEDAIYAATVEQNSGTLSIFFKIS